MIRKVIITEVLEKIIEVESETDCDALDIVRKRYKDCDIILTADDYKDTNFEILEEK